MHKENEGCTITTYHQSVCVQFEPPLKVAGYDTWQLMRAAHCSSISNEVEYKFALVAMEASGDPVQPTATVGDDNTDATSGTYRHLLCLAPAKIARSNPLAKDALELRPFRKIHYSPTERNQVATAEAVTDLPFFWDVERFEGGGIAFSTTLLQHTPHSESDQRGVQGSKHYVTDDARLCSTIHTGGNPIGFTMKLAFPPVVDVTTLCDVCEGANSSEENEGSLSAAITEVINALHYAATDCGFFFVILRSSDVCSFPPLNRESADASDRTQPVTKAAEILSSSSRYALSPQSLLKRGHRAYSRSEKQWLQKVTLATTSGEVKSMVGSTAQWGPVKLPNWLLLHDSDGEETNHSRYHNACCDDPEKERKSTEMVDSLSALSSQYLTGAMEVASRITGALQSTCTASHPLRYQPTPQADLFGLLRLICYPPGTVGDGNTNSRSSITTAETGNVSPDAVYNRPGNAVVHEGQLGTVLAPHTDKTWITLLAASPSLDGLDVIDCDGVTFTPVRTPAWVTRLDLDSKPDARGVVWLCNIGDAFQMASHGKYLSREHRARNIISAPSLSTRPSDERRQQQEPSHECFSGRVSLPLFVEPRADLWPMPYAADAVKVQIL